MPIGPTLVILRDQFLRVYIDDRAKERFTDAELLPLLNEAQRFVQEIIDHQDPTYFQDCFNGSVVPADDALEFTLPDNLKSILRAERRVPGGIPIPAHWTTFVRRHEATDLFLPPPTTTGGIADRPIVYLRGQKIGVVSPAGTYTLDVWYTKFIPDLSADGDFSEIPPQHRNLIALHAAKLTKGEGVDPLPADLETVYRRGIQNLELFIQRRQNQAPREVAYYPD